jgi:hypothetical protein
MRLSHNIIFLSQVGFFIHVCEQTDLLEKIEVRRSRWLTRWLKSQAETRQNSVKVISPLPSFPYHEPFPR